MSYANEIRRAHREALRAHARESLYGFYRLGFPALAPEASFSEAPHFRVLARALEKVARGETRRLLIAIPPRHGKSILASVVLPAWILGRDPTRKIMCASYGDALSKDFSNRFRDLLWSPQYGAVFPGTQIDAGGASLSEVRTTAKGYRLATTVQGPATGKGAHFAIVDDPFKASEAASESMRNAVYDWFKGSLMTRFDKPAEGAMVVVQQRLHQDDLIGRLRDEGGWEYLEMPGESVKRQTFDLGNGESWDFEPGALLFPESFDRAALDQLFWDLGEAAYNAQILQRPSPPGDSLFKLKYFQRYDILPMRYDAIVQSWDPAVVDTETAAFSVCTTWGILGQRLYLIDVFRKRLEFRQIEPAILSMRQKYNAGAVVIEVSGVGAAIGNALLKREGTRTWMAPVDPKLGKLERAIAQTPKIERKRVFLPMSAPWLETFESEVASFPMSKFADQVDSMVHFLGFLDVRSRWTYELPAYRNHRERPF
ncbi:MAG: phage terminase large subunit [Roseiarcus sp.]|jgi:predicted phage terminase large subunit-like protein